MVLNINKTKWSTTLVKQERKVKMKEFTRELCIEFTQLSHGTIGNLLAQVEAVEDKGVYYAFAELMELPHIEIRDKESIGTLQQIHILVVVLIVDNIVSVAQAVGLDSKLQVVYEKPTEECTAKDLHKEVCKALFYRI